MNRMEGNYLKKLHFMLIISIVMLLLAACGEKNDSEVEEDKFDPNLIVEVDLQIPETAEPNENVKIQAVVTYGDEKVTDADKVVFGIRKDSEKKESEQMKAKHTKDGIYEIETSFAEDGIYHVTAHTDAKDMHVMPSKTIAIGNVEHHDEHDDQQDDHHQHGDHHESDSHGDHEHDSMDGFMMHFMEPENVAVDKNEQLVVHIQLDDAPLTDARVRFEVWKDGEEKHEFLNAREDIKGEYTVNHRFKEAGDYQVKIHVEAENDLHEHEEYTIEVK